MTDSEKWSCAECGAAQEPQNETRTLCPQCGSLARHIELHFEDAIAVKAHDWLDAKMKNVTFPSKKKLRRHLQIGTQWSTGRSTFVEKVRDLDKDKDTYYELVTDPSTGELLRHCDEPLSEHINRGSAKAKGVAQQPLDSAKEVAGDETV